MPLTNPKELVDLDAASSRLRDSDPRVAWWLRELLRLKRQMTGVTCHVCDTEFDRFYVVPSVPCPRCNSTGI
jgi:hypothetical protein